MKSPSLESSSPIGVSIDIGSLETFIIFLTFSSGRAALAVSPPGWARGQAPGKAISSPSLPYFIVSRTWTGTLIVRA